RLGELGKSDHSPEVALDVETMRTVYDAGPAAVESSLRERLTRRYGFLGRLAFAYGVPANEEPRKSLMNQAFWFMARVSLVGVIISGIVVVSVALFIAGCVWFFQGKIHASQVPDTSSLQAFLEAFAIYLALFQICGRLIRLFGGASIQWTWIALLILPLVSK